MRPWIGTAHSSALLPLSTRPAKPGDQASPLSLLSTFSTLTTVKLCSWHHPELRRVPFSAEPDDQRGEQKNGRGAGCHGVGVAVVLGERFLNGRRGSSHSHAALI